MWKHKTKWFEWGSPFHVKWKNQSIPSQETKTKDITKKIHCAHSYAVTFARDKTVKILNYSTTLLSSTFGLSLAIHEALKCWKQYSSWQLCFLRCPIEIIFHIMNSQKTHLQIRLLFSLDPISSICALQIINTHTVLPNLLSPWILHSGFSFFRSN